MKPRHDYFTGPHHFGMHFWCGLVFGIGLGALWTSYLFENGALILIGAVATGIVVAYCAGRWGDSVWHWLIKHLVWWV
jgi:prolipoprotein diacylglyceryltransferase